MADIFELLKKISSQAPASGSIEHIIVGLGNPGREYDGTRHNIGFSALDYIGNAYGIPVKNAKFNALVGDGMIGTHRVLLMKPQTYMNLSGEAVVQAVSFYKIPPECITVICDDVNFDTGIMRIRRKGSFGGHNGIGSIIKCLASEGFARIKIGVGKKPTPEYDMANWVLGHLSRPDIEKTEALFDSVKHACELILDGKIEEAMNKYSK